MNKKEMINNNCQMCEYSAKEYLCIRNKFALIKASFCTNMDMSERERKKCIADKAKCKQFKLATTIKEEQISDIKIILSEINEQLSVITYKLNELKETAE